MRYGILIIAVLTINHVNAQQTTLNIEDLIFLDNTRWKGTLMYVNYSDGKEVDISKELKITIQGNKLIMENTYPNEPKANTRQAIKLRKNGAYFGKEKISSVDKQSNDNFTIRTKTIGKDNGVKAFLIKTYTIASETLMIAKEVQVLGSSRIFLRNKSLFKKHQP